MLKTTTETGDIGIFSIGPGLPAPATYHQPPRPRRRLKDVDVHHAGHQGDKDAFHDDRKRLPSYRDTTSEIISLYGFDTQRSYRSFSPSIDDARRSYSLTTCSSQAMASHKSCATFHTYSSAGGLQRPRSPFPYPTRLKRPEMRPSSPALTDNGVIDHIRTVELNRPSQRTLQGSRKPDYSQGNRCPPPMSIRPDVNRSTSSLPSRASPGPYGYGSGFGRSRTPNSVRSWTPGHNHRPRRGSNEHSLRTASLTSIVEMYQGPPVSTHELPLRPMASFYYDYTEGFEQQVPKIPQLPETICPIPQRSDSVARPFVLCQEIDDALHLSPGHGTSESTERRSNESDGIASSACPPSSGSEEEPCGCLPVQTPCDSDGHKEAILTVPALHTTQNAQVMQLGGSHGGETPETPERQREETNRTDIVLAATNVPSLTGRDENKEVKPVHESIDDGQQLVTNGTAPYPSNTWAGETVLSKATVDQSVPSHSSARLRGSFDPALAEFASMFASFDRLARSPFSKAGDETYLSASFQDTKRGRRWRWNGRNRAEADSPLGSLVSEKKSYRKRHRRNAATMNMSTGGVKDIVAYMQDTKEGDRTVERNATRQVLMEGRLKPKLDAPRLMKPLPPLPDEAELNKEPHGRVFVTESSRTGVPRLRLRAKASPSTEAEEIAEVLGSLNEGPTVPPKSDTRLSKPKLRLKLSRAHLGLRSASKSATILRSPALKQCNALAEFQHCARNDLFTPQPSTFSDVFTPPIVDAVHDAALSVPDDPHSHGAGPSPQPSDQFDIPYPPSPAIQGEGQRDTPCDTPLGKKRSFLLESGLKEHRKLRQKISMLRLRIAGTHLARQGRSVDTAPLFNIKGFSTPSLLLEEAELGIVPTPEKAGESTQQPDNHGGRVKRWANSAKQAVRSYVKKTLDRNSRVTH